MAIDCPVHTLVQGVPVSAAISREFCCFFGVQIGTDLGHPRASAFKNLYKVVNLSKTLYNAVAKHHTGHGPGAHVMSTCTGISFFIGIVRSVGGGILKSFNVAGMVPASRMSLPRAVN